MLRGLIFLLAVGLIGCPGKQEPPTGEKTPVLQFEYQEIDLDGPREEMPDDVRVVLELIDEAAEQQAAKRQQK